MNLKQLRFFIEIVESGSASTAAARLFTAPTAISMQISQLEDSLGGKLFDRSRRPMALTTLGEFFYPKAKELIASFSQVNEEARGVASGNLGWLSIGFVRSTIFSVLPDAVREMRRRFPKARIDLTEMLSEHQVKSILDGAIHIGISRQIGDYKREAGMLYVSLMKDPLVAAVPLHHRLASKKAVSAKDLDALPFVCFPKDPFSSFARQSLDYLRGQGGTPVPAYEAKEIHTALGLVAAGLGVTLVGRTVATNNRSDVKFLPLKGGRIETEIFAVVPANLQHALTESFLSVLKEVEPGGF